VLKPFARPCQAVAFWVIYIYGICMQKHIPAPKTRMVRKQVYITAEQDQRLKARAKAEGVAASELVRAGIERELGSADVDGGWPKTFLDSMKGPGINEATARRMKKAVEDLRRGPHARLDDIINRMHKPR
jgi:hypothetical protein